MSRPHRLAGKALVVAWIAQLLAAAIMGQTLFFKFSGAPEPVYIFSTLGAEPYGRIATAVLELVAALALLVPRTAALGAVMSIGLMLGAIGAHLTKLGIEVRLPDQAEGDGGTLFVLALVTLVAAVVVSWLRRADLPLLGSRLARA